MGEILFVYVDNAGVPTKLHHSRADAEREAERLARKYPGTHVHILGVIGTCVVNAPPVEWVKKLAD